MSNLTVVRQGFFTLFTQLTLLCRGEENNPMLGKFCKRAEIILYLEHISTEMRSVLTLPMTIQVSYGCALTHVQIIII